MGCSHHAYYQLFNCLENYFRQRPLILHVSCRDFAFASSSSSDFIRHPQLPSVRDGVFMRASLSSPKTSCMGMIANAATDVMAARMNASGMSLALVCPR